MPRSPCYPCLGCRHPKVARKTTPPCWMEWAARSLKAQTRARLCGPVDLIIRMDERRGGARASHAIEAAEAALTAAGILRRSDAAQLRSVRLVWMPIAGMTLEIARAR